MEYFGVKSPINPEDERDAIAKYLKRYWVVENDKISLDGIIDRPLYEGILRGEAEQEVEMMKLAVFYKAKPEWALAWTGRQDILDFIEYIQFSNINHKPPKFHEHVKAVNEEMSEEFGHISAEPVGYEYFCRIPELETHEEKEFKGHRLHSFCCNRWPSFKNTMERDSVRDLELFGLTPLNTMIGSIMRQGYNIGAFCVYEKYGKVLNPLRHEEPKRESD